MQAFYTELEDHDEIDVSPFRKLGRNRRKVVMKESYAQPIYLLQDEFLTVMKTEAPEPTLSENIIKLQITDNHILSTMQSKSKSF